MDDYISRKEVINITAETGAWETQNRVRELPAADVQLVKHGRWKYDHTIAEMKHYCCTNCKNSGNECIADENEILWWNFCPRCGCKLDLGGNGDD